MDQAWLLAVQSLLLLGLAGIMLLITTRLLRIVSALLEMRRTSFIAPPDHEGSGQMENDQKPVSPDPKCCGLGVPSGAAE